MKEKEKLWTANFLVLIPLALFLFVNNTIYTSIATTYVASLEDAGVLGGLVNSANAIPALMCRVIAGRCLDRGQRKTIIYIGLGGFCLAALGYAYMPGIWLLILLRAVDGAAFSAATTACQTAATDMIPESRMAEGLSYYSMSNSMSQAISSAIAVALWNRWGFQAFSKASFILMAMSLILTLFFLKTKRPEKTASAPKRRQNSRGEAKQYCQSGENPSRELAAAAGETASFSAGRPAKAACFMFAIAIFNVIRTLYAPKFAIENGIDDIGVFFVLMAVFSILTKLSGKRLLYVCPSKVILAGAIFLNGTSFILLLHARHPAAMVLSAVCAGIATGIDQPVMSAQAVRGIAGAHRGKANGIFMCGNDLSMILGSFFWSFIAGLVGTAGLFWIAAAGLFCVSAGYIGFLLIRRREMAFDEVF